MRHIENIVEVKNNNKGQCLDINVKIQLDYKDLEVVKYPPSCSKCSVGFMNNCGRNIPFKDEDYDHRPSTCKLDLIDLEIVKYQFDTIIKSLEKYGRK